MLWDMFGLALIALSSGEALFVLHSLFETVCYCLCVLCCLSCLLMMSSCVMCLFPEFVLDLWRFLVVEIARKHVKRLVKEGQLPASALNEEEQSEGTQMQG